MKRLNKKAPWAWAGCGAGELRGTNPLCAYTVYPKSAHNTSFVPERKRG
jgi:hypothetical protein